MRRLPGTVSRRFFSADQSRQDTSVAFTALQQGQKIVIQMDARGAW